MHLCMRIRTCGCVLLQNSVKLDVSKPTTSSHDGTWSVICPVGLHEGVGRQAPVLDVGQTIQNIFGEERGLDIRTKVVQDHGQDGVLCHMHHNPVANID